MKHLKTVVVGGNTTTVTFSIKHNNNSTTLDQDLILKKSADGWTAYMEMVDFPPQKTITESAHKLAEWFERMACEIRAHEYDSLNLNDFDS